MKRTLRICLSQILLLLAWSSSHGQTLRGNVTDGQTAKPLYGATVIDRRTDQVTHTDELGIFSLQAQYGDSIAFQFSGYHTEIRVANISMPLQVELQPLSVRLKEFVVRDLTPFQRDSMELTSLYSKELNTERVKPGFSNANGGGFTGIIGSAVQKISRSYKQNKRFKENFEHDMQQKYIDTRYTQPLVTSLTGLTGDTVVLFMNTHPMDYAFARAATDLELKMWIRSTYKTYLQETGNNPVTKVDQK